MYRIRANCKPITLFLKLQLLTGMSGLRQTPVTLSPEEKPQIQIG